MVTSASALDRGKRPVPIDPAFSLTSAAALAHAALLAADHDTLQSGARMVDPGFVSPVGVPDTIHRLLRRAPERRSAQTQPIWPRSSRIRSRCRSGSVYALPVINTALIAVGRITEAQAITDQAGSLVAEMDTAPQLTASIHARPGTGGAGTRRTRRGRTTGSRSARGSPRRPPPHRHRRRARPAGRRQRTTRTGLSVVDRDGGQSRAAAPRLPLPHRSDPRARPTSVRTVVTSICPR